MGNAELALQMLADSARRTTGKDAVNQINSSIAFQYNGQKLLGAGPSAVVCIAACYVASSSSTARNTTLNSPSGEFKHLQWPELRDALVQCSDVGRKALKGCMVGMEYIVQGSQESQSRLTKVPQMLRDPRAAEMALEHTFEQVMEDNAKCYAAARRIDEAFDNWLLCVSELHAACILKESTEEEKLIASTLDFAAAQARVDYAIKDSAAAKDASAKIVRQMEAASQSFTKASRNLPDKWQTLAHQIVTGISNSFLTALNQTILPIPSIATPKPDQGTGVLGDLMNRSTIPPCLQPVPPSGSSGPAYPQAVRDVIYCSILQTVLSTGPNGGVNWAMLDGDGSQSVRLVDQMLQLASQTLAYCDSDEEKTVRYAEALKNVQQIAAALLSTSSNHQAEDSEMGKKWHADFDSAYSTILEMTAAAKTLPGAGSSPFSLLSRLNVDRSADSNSIQIQAFAESAATSIGVAAQACNSSQSIYQKFTNVLSQQQTSLSDIQNGSKRWANQDHNLTQTKDIIRQTLITIIMMKEEVATLTECFGALGDSLIFIAKCANAPLIKAAKSEDNPKLGGISLVDLLSANCLGSVFWYNAYSKALGNMASDWLNGSRKFVAEGLMLCDKLADTSTQSDDRMTQRSAQQLWQWSDGAQQGVNEMTNRMRDNAKDLLQGRQEAASRQAEMLQASASAKKSIERGSDLVRNAIEEALEANFNSMLAKYGRK